MPSDRSPSISSLCYSFLKIACCQPSLCRPAISAYHILNDLILPVLSLHLQQMVTEIKQVKAPLLAQQDNDGAAGPVQAVTEALPRVGKETVRHPRQSQLPQGDAVNLEEKRNTQRKTQPDSLSLSLLLPYYVCSRAHTYTWRPEVEVGGHPQLLFTLRSQSLSLTLALQCSETASDSGQRVSMHPPVSAFSVSGLRVHNASRGLLEMCIFNGMSVWMCTHECRRPQEAEAGGNGPS